MRRRGATAALASSPTLIGAITTLIVIVAVFLAYNANKGLPFVPAYRVSVEVPGAARLGDYNEIRIGGTRVGIVESIQPVADEDAKVTAQSDPAAAGAGQSEGDLPQLSARINLKLDEDAGPLPQDSIFRIRYRSPFGLKYVEVVRGTGPAAPEGFVFDGTDDETDATGETRCALPTDLETFHEEIPDAARNGCFQTQTEFDAINNTFDTRTRENNRRNLTGFGGALSARGMSLSDALAQLEPLFRSLRPVAAVLADDRTRLRNFFPALARAARIARPVAREQAELFAFGARVFAAISEDEEALKETIETGHPTFETGIRTLPAQTVFLRNLATFSRALNPGARDLRITLPALNEAIETGTPVLRASPATNRKLKAALRELERLFDQPSTRVTLTRLIELFDEARPLVTWVAPAQTVCNYWNYWFTFLPNGFSDRDPLGHALRQTLTRFPLGTAQAQTPLGGYSGLPANAKSGPVPTSPLGPPDPGRVGQFRPYELPILQTHPYGATGQRNDDCQYGQFGYAPVEGQQLTNRQSPANPANRSSNLPGSRGPTTLFYNADKKRELRDTRIGSRQPQTWRRLAP